MSGALFAMCVVVTALGPETGIPQSKLLAAA